MNYEEWEPFYREILQHFEFSEERDIRSAKLLDGFIGSPNLEILREKIRGKTIHIYGAGPSLEHVRKFPENTKIAADGAASFLLKNNVLPDIIVTDLDGKIKDLLEANKKGSIVIIHAHGDNAEAIKKYASKFKNCFGTTQAEPSGKLNNFGGFTDGDRAVFLAVHFKAKKIFLHGMDFHGGIGKYSLSDDTPEKRKKLLWAEKLIKYLKENSDVAIWFRS